MARKTVLNVVIAARLASMLFACGESGEVDPYATVTLRQATRDMVVSKGFKYKFQNPQIVAMNRNLGLIREGNLLEFIAARSLEDKLVGKTDGSFELAVVKQFSPFVHFKVEKIYTETDTTFMTQAGTIVYPKIWDMAEYGTEGYEEKDIDGIPYNRTGALRALVDQKLRVTAKITVEKEEGRDYYMLHGENAKFRVADTADGTGLFLKVLTENNYPFEGGIIMTGVEDYGARMKSKIAGTVEIQYLKYGNRIVTG
ncbi:MAG: hypothetical protein JSW58_00730 [Candidatus Latescibacterota bacterium]|nr:MAG: hypothetical protein JSW58_00730 [Candidatus Latescibacterota bacterium]